MNPSTIPSGITSPENLSKHPPTNDFTIAQLIQKLIPLTIITGLGAGLGAVIFQWLVFHCTYLFSGFLDYSDKGHVPNPHLPWLGKFFVLITPCIAGLIYGPMVTKFAPSAKGHGVPEVMLAVALNHGKIPARVAVVKAFASALTIGSGGSVGREGPIVQIGSALGSTIAQFFRLPDKYIRLFVACGAAGGISATFHAPFSGPIFAGELILREFSPLSFALCCISSILAYYVSTSIYGDDSFISLPQFTLTSLNSMASMIILGVVIGALGLFFSRFLYKIEDFCDYIWRGPAWIRPTIMGLAIGIIVLILPEMYGVGYPVLHKAIHGDYTIGFLVILLIGKMLATSITLGAGGSGGVFAPTLFIGAMAGSALGKWGHEFFPHMIANPAIWGIIGMGAAFAGATMAPLTGIIIITELTHETQLILPLIIAIAVATILARSISRYSIYTLKLKRRGIDLGVQ